MTKAQEGYCKRCIEVGYTNAGISALGCLKECFTCDRVVAITADRKMKRRGGK